MLSRTLSREGFLAFLESQDPSEEFNWMDYQRCPAVRYAEANGYTFSYDNQAALDVKHDLLHEYSILACPPRDERTAFPVSVGYTYGDCAKLVRERIYGT